MTALAYVALTMIALSFLDRHATAWLGPHRSPERSPNDETADLPRPP